MGDNGNPCKPRFLTIIQKIGKPPDLVMADFHLDGERGVGVYL
jgi:hypothetical protein